MTSIERAEGRLGQHRGGSLDGRVVELHVAELETGSVAARSSISPTRVRERLLAEDREPGAGRRPHERGVGPAGQDRDRVEPVRGEKLLCRARTDALAGTP